MPRPGYDRIGPIRPFNAEDPVRLDPSPLNGGVRLDASALEIPLSAAVKLEDVRFEEKGIRKDFGYTPIGGGARRRVLGLAEHKFIDSGLLFHRLVRIIRNNNNNPELQVWDGDTWVVVDTASETITNTPLVMFSTQGVLVMAEGTQILSWSETPSINTIGHDFPAGNSLTTINESTQVTVTNAGAVDATYTLHYSVDITGDSVDDKIVELEFLHNGEVIGTASYVSEAASTSDSWPHETFETIRPSVEDGDTFSIRVSSFTTGGTQVSDVFDTETVSTPTHRASKSAEAEADGQLYTYSYSVHIPGWDGTGDPNFADVGIYSSDNGGLSWTLHQTITHENNTSSDVEIPNSVNQVIAGLAQGDMFGLSVVDSQPASGEVFLTPVNVSYDLGSVSLDVHGFNQGTDGDPAQGETHDARTGTVSTFQEISPNAPKATFIFPFGDRLLALQDTGDPQKLSWTVDGDIFDWTGFGSGSTSLLDARSDPLDDLIALGAVASNVAVLLRRRSMMRVYETGNPNLAIGVEHWIEGIGTESPLSVKQVRDGIMFLGHDLMVYYFSGAGAPQPVGRPILREVVEDVSEDDLRAVEATFDPVFGEYWLKLPSRVWIFDLAEFLEAQALKWRSRDIQPQRLATVSRIV